MHDELGSSLGLLLYNGLRLSGGGLTSIVGLLERLLDSHHVVELSLLLEIVDDSVVFIVVVISKVLH